MNLGSTLPSGRSGSLPPLPLLGECPESVDEERRRSPLRPSGRAPRPWCRGVVSGGWCLVLTHPTGRNSPPQKPSPRAQRALKVAAPALRRRDRSPTDEEWSADKRTPNRTARCQDRRGQPPGDVDILSPRRSAYGRHLRLGQSLTATLPRLGGAERA